jgi:hypothetical protein
MPDATKPTPRSGAACTCPRIDHSEGTYIVSADCPKHGNPTMTPEREPPEGLNPYERMLWDASWGALEGPYSVETPRRGTMSRITAPDAVDAAERELVADFLYPGCARYFSLLEPGEVRGMLSELARLRTRKSMSQVVKEFSEAALARPAEGEGKP